MKTRVAFTMVLATLVLATTADADAQDRPCQGGKNGIGVRAGTPCVFRALYLYGAIPARPTEIIERPHNGTAVLRADGRIYYSPRPGFTGRDSMKVSYVRDSCLVPEKLQANPAWCRDPTSLEPTLFSSSNVF
jgi:hypothetical protein